MATQHFSSDSTRILIDEQEFFRSTLQSKYLFIKLLTLKTLNHKEPIAAYFCPIIKLQIGGKSYETYNNAVYFHHKSPVKKDPSKLSNVALYSG